MAWDTERTKALLLQAAINEFAEHGRHGARVDRIAAAAGVNKERIYQYFGNKDGLFSAALEDQLDELEAEIPLAVVERAEDLGEFAGNLYDYLRRNPRYLRLLLWDGLETELAPGPAGVARIRHYTAQADAVAKAQAAGVLTQDFRPAELLYAVRALTGWCLSVPSTTNMVLGLPCDRHDPQQLRALLVRLASRMVQP